MRRLPVGLDILPPEFKISVHSYSLVGFQRSNDETGD